nr:MAG TPA: major capsid protein [Caudoviricetes sp.]
MAATKVESLTNPRDSLPNTYTSVTAREVDFVTRFNDNWDALRTILGIMRPIRKAPGTQLISYTADVTLEDGDVGAGEVIPYSKATITQATKDDLTIKKYAKAVPIEDVDKYGAEIAVEKSDDAFLTKLQNVVLGDFYTFLNTGSLTGTATTWQAALAKAQGEVLNKFAVMAKDVTSVVGFANILDAYDYLGTADITVQTQFGINYVKDFMGYSTLFLLPATVSGNAAIARNTVIATPVENIDLYYADPGDSEFARLGLNYTVQGETNLIGFHAQGNYSTAVGETYAIMGMKLWAEYLDGIAKITVSAGGLTARLSGLTIGALTLTPTFDPDTTEYTATTTNATNTVTATPEDESATVTILNGETPVSNGAAATWAEGTNTLTITVKNGSAQKVYTVTVTKST